MNNSVRQGKRDIYMPTIAIKKLCCEVFMKFCCSSTGLVFREKRSI